MIPFLDLAAVTSEVADDVADRWRELISTSSFIGGEVVQAFEEDWARYCGTAHAVAVGNGTDALRLTLEALGVGAGDEVIVPANTFVATAAAVVATGATPVFVDVDPDTLLITAQAVLDAAGPSTAAVLPVHLYGQVVDMDAIRAASDRLGIVVIEDAAQAHGATWRGGRAGSLGSAGCFSFYPGKNLGAFGDAGAVTTNDAALAERLRSLANHGRAPDSHHEHVRVGSNSRMDALQAAVLLAKLPHLDRWTEMRRTAAARYDDGVESLEMRRVVVARDAESAHHLYVVRVHERDRVREELTAAGIVTGIHYPIPCHLQPAFAAATRPKLPTAEEAAGQILSLPMFPSLTAGQVEDVLLHLSSSLRATEVLVGE